MTDFTELNSKDLDQAILDTTKALELGRQLMTVVATNTVTDGLKRVADATPTIMSALEAELKDLRNEKKSRK